MEFLKGMEAAEAHELIVDAEAAAALGGRVEEGIGSEGETGFSIVSGSYDCFSLDTSMRVWDCCRKNTCVYKEKGVKNG